MTERHRLSNGLTVLFEPQHEAKVAAFQVWVKAGSADERPDQAGLAHVHEHMLFKGTARRGPGQIAREVEAHGGEINAWTSFDQTVYHVVMASQFAEMGLDILGDAIRSSTFDPGELSRELEVICEEIKRAEDMPSRRASRDLFSTMYAVHPYGRPVIGWERTVRSFTQEKVFEFFHRHYTPQNMVLTAVGDLERDQLLTWAEAKFGGDWGRPYEGLVERAKEPALTGRRFHIRPDNVRELYLHLGFPIPPVRHDDVPALDVLAMVLGQGDASRLSLAVKRQGRLVNDISAYAYTPKDAGLFGVALTLPPDKAHAALSEATRHLHELRDELVSDEELGTVKALVESDAVYGRETVQGLARKLGYYETGAGGIEAEARYYQRIAALTPEDLRTVARRYLKLDACVCTALTPQDTVLTEADLAAALDAGRAPATEAKKRSTRRLSQLEALAQGPEGTASLNVQKALAPHSGTGGVTLHRLSSGARVLVREEGAVPLFAVRAVFLGGVRNETAETNGLTALLSRTMTRGTPRHSAEDISHLIDAYAGSLSAMGGRNSFSLRGEFLSKHFDRAMSLFEEVLLEPQFPEAEVEREKSLLLQDIHTREDKPSAVAFDLFHKQLFLQHPYRLHMQGEASSVTNIDAEALRRHYLEQVDLSQMVLCVVGDVKTEAVVRRAEEAFGKSRLSSRGNGKIIHPRAVALEAPPTSPRTTKHTLAKAQTHLVYGFQGARLTDPDRRSLEVLSTLLSGQGGRLFVELRDKRSMAYSVTSYAVEGVDPGYFALYIGTSPEKVDAALEGMKDELRKIREELATDAELLRAKRHLIGSQEIGLQRNGARAALFALDELYGLSYEAGFRYAEEIGEVTLESVRDVAQRYLQPERSALAVVGP